MHSTLEGIRVISLAVNLPGPLAAARLAQFGASVLKVEPPSGDPLAFAAPAWYADLIQGQEVSVLDLKDPADLVVLRKDLATTDLLITAMRPSALRRLELDDAPSRFPGLSHIEIVGHDGDSEELPGHDLNYQAAHGTVQPPLMPAIPAADLLGSERAVSAALLALLNRTNAGSGSTHRVVLDDAAAAAGASARYGLNAAVAAFPTYGIYATTDGYIALGALEPHFQVRTCEALGIKGTREELAKVFGTESTDHWVALGVDVDVPITGIDTPSQAGKNT